jgi:hypothetical protein
MPFVEVAMGLRAGICNILNHAFSPHLASTGLHCLVVDAPLALRYHVFVPREKSGADVDEYQEMGETEAHWANIEILRSHCKVYGLAQEGTIKELQERIQRSMANKLIIADVDWHIPSNDETASVTFGDGNLNMGLNLRALNAKIIELDVAAATVLQGQKGPQLRGAQAKAHKQLARTKLAQLSLAASGVVCRDAPAS